MSQKGQLVLWFDPNPIWSWPWLSQLTLTDYADVTFLTSSQGDLYNTGGNSMILP